MTRTYRFTLSIGYGGKRIEDVEIDEGDDVWSETEWESMAHAEYEIWQSNYLDGGFTRVDK